MGVLSHQDRVVVARSAIDYVMGREPDELGRAVPNCPGWTVYNAAVHVGRAALGWAEMITSAPNDATALSRTRACWDQPAGQPLETLAQWAQGTIDLLSDDQTRPAFYPFPTSEAPTVGLWGWHAAAEIGVHRLDIEAALEHPHSMTDTQAQDACDYAITVILPGMASRDDTQLPPLIAELRGDNGQTFAIGPSSLSNEVPAVVRGPAVQVLLALWGRTYHSVEVTEPAALAAWAAVPRQQVQLGTWE